MANNDPEALKAAQLAYERSNVSLKDYNPAALPEDERVSGLVERDAPAEPVLTTADAAPADAPSKPSK